MGSQNCVLWNRLDNTRTTTNSEIGTDFVENGSPSYVPVFHQGGMDCDTNAKYASIADYPTINNDEGFISFWWQPHYNSGTAGNYFMFSSGSSAAATFWIAFVYSVTDLFLQVGDNWAVQASKRINPTWVAEDIIHVGLWYNRLSGGDTVEIYLNGATYAAVVENQVNWGVLAVPSPNEIYVGTAQPWLTTGDCAIDNFKYWDDAAEGLASIPDRWIEGFGGQKMRVFAEEPLPPPVQVIEPIVCAKSYPQVLVAGKDLYSLGYVREIINIDEYKTFRQSKLIQNNYNLILNNMDDTFSVGNPVSLFAGTDWRYSSIQILDEDNEEIWNGVIEDVRRNHKTKLATMITKNSLVRVMNTKISYISSDWETPADAAKNILDQEGFTDYNVASFNRSAAVQDDNDCYVKCYFNTEDDLSLQACLEKIGEFGASYVYSHAGDIYYKHWQPFTGGVKVNLTSSDLATAPMVSSAINDLVNDYSIGYEGDLDIPATDSANGNIGNISRSKFSTHSIREMGGGANTQIVFKDLTSAVYIGETLIRRVHVNLNLSSVEPLTLIAFSLPLKHQEWVDLETYFRLTFSEEGWTNKLFEIFRFQRNFDRDRMDVLAMGVQE